LSQFPIFEKFNWLSVEPEFDPYKYNSFAKTAGHITYLLTERLNRKLTNLADPSLLPPIMTFQSLVDSTVRVPALLNNLYARLPNNGSELVLFDINRRHDLEPFIDDTERDLVNRLDNNPGNPFSYTLVTNESGDSVQMVARTRAQGATEFDTVALNMAWPGSVYSLSHVSLLFEPDDRWYGSTESEGFVLGTLAPRGETAILTAPIGRFMRLRYNPFFDYLAERTLRFCEVCIVAGN